MPVALQVAFFLACVAIVLFVSFLTLLSILVYRRVSSAARHLEEAKTDLKQLMQDSRAMIHNVSLLSSRANQQLDELEKVVRVVRRWTERADQVAEEVTAAVAPAITVARSLKILYGTWRIIVGGLAGNSGQTNDNGKETSQAEEVRMAMTRRVRSVLEQVDK